MTKWALYQECKDSIISTNQSMWHTTLANWKIKPYAYLNRCRESLWQNSTLFMIKNPPETRHRWKIPQHNKSHIWQIHSKHYPQWWKIERISPKVRNKTRVPTLTTTIQHSFGSFSHSSHRRKRNKRNPDWKRRIKLSLFADDMILYIENLKHSTRKLLELINEYNKVAGYKLTQRNPLHSYTLTMRKQKEKLRKQFHSPLQWKE